MKNDPRWIKARFAGKCSHCHETIGKNDRAYWYPLTRTILCETCGEKAARGFNAAATAEELSR